ncbi:MAG: hypothetical protein Athens101410_533 [Parcubacteria group bacterium Athens1014_10]|nr:MAG: hypothetical protein Athens101410_533 [Parcubacteria group bacterium Athens1014_10]TSD05459.1 MAG: hypothetical protein Athens071412_368 [Parcubacteria group bacterium Athens0714_12]
MKRKIILISFIFLLLFSLIGCKKIEQNKVCFKDNCFYVELAKTRAEQTRGLMLRKNLDSNRGMLFIFEEEKNHSFWMKNTLITLDIIWLDKDKKVIFIKKDAQPCGTDKCFTITPDDKALYVLELNSGAADKIDLSLEDKMTFDLK